MPYSWGDGNRLTGCRQPRYNLFGRLAFDVLNFRAIYRLGVVPMEQYFTRILRPVKRLGAERYVRLMLLSFAVAVVLTRVYLSLTGYPQLGSGILHIAHLLWGGLLLFIAALLPLVLANRWVYPTSGILSGVGVGLFIDEVGKFITRNNDYFYPAAAPIIYAFFLLTVLLYLQVRRPPSRDDRAELYRAFDEMAEVLDRDLDPHEKADLDARLRAIVARNASPDYVRLAQVLLEFLYSDTAFLARPKPRRFAGLASRARTLDNRVVNRDRLRITLAAGLLFVASLSLVPATLSAFNAADPNALPAQVADNPAIAAPQTSGVIPAPDPVEGQRGGQANRPIHPEARSVQARVAFWMRLGLEGLVGAMLVAGAFFLLFRRERRGIWLAFFGLLLALTTVNLLVFYFDQFSAVTEALLQFALLEGLIYYRRHFLVGPRSVPA